MGPHRVCTSNGKEESKMLLDGHSITVESLLAIGPTTQIDLTEEAWVAVRKSRKIVDKIVENNQTVYGINTGIGSLSEAVISPDKLSILQENIIRSHAVGVGSILSQERTKRLLALRINVLAKGYSGITEETLRRMIAFFNSNCISKVPEQGTLGASGDLAPLSHLAIGMMGEGEMWSPKTGQLESAARVIKEAGLKKLELGPKEGVALINGTQMIAALGAEAVWRAENLVITADAITAISLEALQGTVKAYYPEIHRQRPHTGQKKSAQTMRCLLHSRLYPSEIALAHSHCNKVQDAYSLRCVPQVHGVVYDTIAFVKNIIQTEMNSATDNPMVFSDTGNILSGGNFHGEYPSKSLDFLTIAVHELANISERRIERLTNSSLSGLPPFLVDGTGLSSGFMIAHCTAAALVSENKTLSHPASVDSISTSAAKEDHVSMGGWAARKCLQVVENVEVVLAIELFAATQGLSLRRPLKASEPVEALYSLVREKGGVAPLVADRFMGPDIEAVRKLISDKLVAKVVEPYLKHWATLDPNDNHEYQE